MSGIVGILNLDAAPVERALLESLTAQLSTRGPDAQHIWTETSVGLGHALLRTQVGAADMSQPHTRDGNVWIVADARIDARDHLLAELGIKGASGANALCDSDLILLAYHKWRADCVLHLLGDFAFAIWDRAERTLFCARDHFGVRPFYYTKSDRHFVFSNDLNTLRLHPAVSSTLNDIAILNFLIFHYQPRVDLTTFADVSALPPASRLLVHDGQVEVDEYWTLPIEEPLRFQRRSDYAEGFREVFRDAIADRAGFDRAGILLSGGMDSTSIAAALTSFCNVPPSSLTAFTYGYTRLPQDREPHYAQLVADRLEIPWRFVSRDNDRWFEGWDQLAVRFPEPLVNSPFWKPTDAVRMAALNDDIRVFFNGWGPDLMMRFEPSYYWDSIRELEPLSLIRSVAEFVREHHQRPPFSVRSTVQRFLWSLSPSNGLADSTITSLLTPEFTHRRDLPKSWWQYAKRRPTHPRRRVAYEGLTCHYWTLLFASSDAATWGAPVEFRYPYFDVRVVRYLLRMPVLPWCANKALLREAMQGLLPSEVLTRTKTPFGEFPRHATASWVRFATIPGKRLSRYVIPEKTRHLVEQHGTDADVTRRLVALDHWMEHCAGVSPSSGFNRSRNDYRPPANTTDSRGGGHEQRYE